MFIALTLSSKKLVFLRFHRSKGCCTAIALKASKYKASDRSEVTDYCLKSARLDTVI